MTAPIVVLGIDVSPKRLGYGLVTLDDGTAVACGMEPIDLPNQGWMEQQVTEALKALPACHVAAVFIEQPALPPVSGTKSAFNAGRAIQVTHTVVRRKWPEAPVEYLQPSSWRRYAGIKGNATKAEVFSEAVRLWAAAGLPPDDALGWAQDTADALLVATAGFHCNEEIIEKAAARAQR